MDCLALNLVTIKDRFPIPMTDELLDEQRGVKYFSKMDLRAEYHKIPIHSIGMEKTTLETHNGHYEFQVMPFGLSNPSFSF